MPPCSDPGAETDAVAEIRRLIYAPCTLNKSPPGSEEPGRRRLFPNVVLKRTFRSRGSHDSAIHPGVPVITKETAIGEEILEAGFPPTINMPETRTGKIVYFAGFCESYRCEIWGVTKKDPEYDSSSGGASSRRRVSAVLRCLNAVMS
ncbi:hypothetical protein Bbelb_340990 [Branchiostoma belcheri]|nr:hypothetical protein Bbelb_340990 [Branchiostoma belcheri]